MYIDEKGNIHLQSAQTLKDLGNYALSDYDDVAHELEETLNKSDEDEEMAEMLNY